MVKRIKVADRAVLLGANSALGAGVAEVLAAAGYKVTALARDRAKATAAVQRAQAIARSEAIPELITAGTYDEDLAAAADGAALILEALADDQELKVRLLRRVEPVREHDSIIISLTCTMSIGALAGGLSPDMRARLVGVRLFNPPHVYAGAEVIAHAATAPEVTGKVLEIMRARLAREAVVAPDTPGFIATRVALGVLCAAAAAAPEQGVERLDYLLGGQCGFGAGPLTVIDALGWDRFAALVGAVRSRMPAIRQRLVVPDYLERGPIHGWLGDRTGSKGGFYRRAGKQVEVLDFNADAHRSPNPPAPVQWIEQMKGLIRVGRYREAIKVVVGAEGTDADLVRRAIAIYIDDALSLEAEMNGGRAAIDTIVASGWGWAPPSALIDALGAGCVAEMLARYNMALPPILERAARSGERLFSGGVGALGRTLSA